MNKKTVLGFNAPKDVGFYVSFEDIEYALTYKDNNDNTLTELGLKSGNKVTVFGSAYHILNLKNKE